MGKESALGHDPLSWMRMTKDIKKSTPSEEANTSGQNAEKSEQQINDQTILKQQVLHPADSGKVQDVPKSSQPPGNTLSTPATAKPKVVIGRLYEKLSTEKGKPVQRNETETPEARRYIEPSFPVSKTLQQPVKRMETEMNRIPTSAAAGNFSTYIIVAYTALLLILGYFVYNDLSKRTSRIEARILAIEKTLQDK